ncbi:integrase catalytic domain-containing protein [Trichonephila inaurata madagascariensis]|uniref:Integrase catalytic domain-containing protein n=1 Tax=Trichonephila inaurata madagascariensis TaxID=2747483 RepID=A0A8X6YMX1_9ARAC|nr:integrase catalytic domain-containing protein [Trichonephila inaurata madagascariensis]
MCADIQHAFLEIGIKEDRIYLQFLWGHDNGTCLDLEGQPVRVLRMTRVPFEVNCSPFLLAATIRTHLEKYEHFEVTKKLHDLYVDDFLCSVDNLAKAKQFVKDATYILSDAGMNLRKWITSSAELRKWLKTENINCRGNTSVLIADQKVLGLVWNVNNDSLAIDTSHKS